MKKIELTQGQVAIVDDADYNWLSQWKWYALKDCSGNFYAIRNALTGNGNRYRIRMSRLILGLEYVYKRQGDHINHNTLDNRRSNLRICTASQNAMNRKLQRNTSSIFKGVSWQKLKKKWRAYIKINGARKHLGYFKIENEAARVYDVAAIKYFGEFACLNFELELIKCL